MQAVVIDTDRGGWWRSGQRVKLVGRYDDADNVLEFTYGRPTPAMSNAERQRRFRQRNPGYYARLQAARRAAAKRSAEPVLAAVRAALVAAMAAEREGMAPVEPLAADVAIAAELPSDS